MDGHLTDRFPLIVAAIVPTGAAAEIAAQLPERPAFTHVRNAQQASA